MNKVLYRIIIIVIIIIIIIIIFNNFFTSVRLNLASKLSPSNVNPESHLQPTKTAFSLRALSVTTVCEPLSQIDEKKAMG